MRQVFNHGKNLKRKKEEEQTQGWKECIVGPMGMCRADEKHLTS